MKLLSNRAMRALAVAMLMGASAAPTLGADEQSPIQVTLSIVPPAGRGGEETFPIAGTVRGAPPGSVVVIWARNDQNVLWVQPWGNAYHTSISNQAFTTITHPGLEYTVAIVRPTFTSPTIRGTLPPLGGDVLALFTFRGRR
jgi:hypothetical protein